MSLNSKAFSESLSKALGKQFAENRKRKGLTQAQLSKMIGVSEDTLSSYEKGRVSIPFDKVLLLATVLRIESITFHTKTYSSMFLDEVSFHVDMEICQEIKRALDTTLVDMRTPLIYSMIKQIMPYETSIFGNSILDLYMQYCYSIKDKDGVSVIDEAYIDLPPKEGIKIPNNQEIRFLDPPQEPSNMQEGSVKVTVQL